MKKNFYTPLLVFVFVWIALPVFSQEFTTYENDLIYSPTTIKRLNFIADSLNLQYRSCIKKDWKPFKQTFGFNYYEYDSTTVELLVSALKEGKSRQEIEKIQGRKELDTDTILAVEYNYFDEDSNQYRTAVASLGDDKIISLDIVFPLNKITTTSSSDGGTWVWKKERSWYDKKYTLTFYYLITPFRTYTIPIVYNDWINYAQCMVDTSTDIFTYNAKRTGGFYRYDSCDDTTLYSMRQFSKRVSSAEEKFTETKPEKPDRYRGKDESLKEKYNQEFSAYIKKEGDWQRRYIAFVNKELHKEKDFEKIAYKAWKEARDNNCYSLSFAEDLGKYYNKSLALDLMRARIVVGICSMDRAPRQHLCDIALLAAEAGRWDVFLRAHLNMVNDYASRNSDNSIAQKRRGIYMQELEAIPLDLMKLFPGMIFRIDNAPKHHYYSTLVRSANAMALSKDPAKFQKMTLEIASNKNLDWYNRMIFAYVYRNICFYLRDINKKSIEKELTALTAAITDLPQFLQKNFSVTAEDYEYEDE